MENLRIAVVSQDEAYNRTFCMSLLHVCRQIEVTSYTTRQFVLKWAAYEGPGAFYDTYDIILWAGDEISDSYGDNIVFLCDRISQTRMDYAAKKFAVFRYSPAGVMIAAVFDIYSHLTGRAFPLVKRDDVKLFAFISYCGGSGCTTIARSVGQELARFHGMRVLCISLEDIESAGEFTDVPEGIKTEGELLYRLLGKGSLPLLEPYLVRDDFGVCSFAPPEGKNPLGELTAEDMNTLIAGLMGCGMFDVIIADLSTGLTEAALEVMEAAERICIVAKTQLPGVREQSYMNQIEADCGEAMGKMVRAVNLIPEGRNHIEIGAPLEGDFGRDISKLTERLNGMVE